jgi:hypothetical protein
MDFAFTRRELPHLLPYNIAKPVVVLATGIRFTRCTCNWYRHEEKATQKSVPAASPFPGQTASKLTSLHASQSTSLQAEL